MNENGGIIDMIHRDMEAAENNTISLSAEDIYNILVESGARVSAPAQHEENTTQQDDDVEDFGISDMPTDEISATEAAPEDSTVDPQPVEATNTQEETAPVIPPLSHDINTTASTLRFSGSPWFNEIQYCKIVLAGLGGIGSNLAYLLAKMRPSCIYLYDPDIVEPVNMAGQLYTTYDMYAAKQKAYAVSDVLSQMADYYNAYAHTVRYTSACATANIMICGFDNMESRKQYFQSWLTHINRCPEKKYKCLYLDGRLSADIAQVLTIQGDDEYAIKLYQDKYLFDDDAAQQAPCSFKQTAYTAFMIASLMANMVVNFITNYLHPDTPMKKALPIFTEYDSNLMMLRTEY